MERAPVPDKVHMEIDSGDHQLQDSKRDFQSISGKVIHFNKGAAFFRFTPSSSLNNGGGEEQGVCLFRPNKLYVDGQKLGASNFKSVETISAVLSVGDTVSGLAVRHTDTKPYKLDTLEAELVPGWYATIVWKVELLKFDINNTQNSREGIGLYGPSYVSNFVSFVTNSKQLSYIKNLYRIFALLLALCIPKIVQHH